MDDVKIKSLYKALSLLDFFTSECPERGVSELAELTGMYKSTVHNFLSTFEKRGFIDKDHKTGKYRLGIKILQLYNVLYTTSDLRNTVRAVMESLGRQTGECVYFALPAGKEIIYLDAYYPPGMVSARSIIGIKAPLYCTGVGKAILAFMPDGSAEALAENNFTRFTPNTITDIDLLTLEIARIRKLGYAIDNMEHEHGIKCVAVPIKNINNDVIASMSLSGPSPRFTNKKISEYSELLLNTAGILKEQLLR